MVLLWPQTARCKNQFDCHLILCIYSETCPIQTCNGRKIWCWDEQGSGLHTGVKRIELLSKGYENQCQGSQGNGLHRSLPDKTGFTLYFFTHLFIKGYSTSVLYIGKLTCSGSFQYVFRNKNAVNNLTD